MELRDGRGPRIRPIVRVEETVSFGTSTTIDSMWNSGWLKHDTQVVEVTWLIGVEFAHHKITIHRWVLLEGKCLAIIADLFIISNQVYVLLELYEDALAIDAATSQMWALEANLKPEALSGKAIQKIEAVPDVLWAFRGRLGQGEDGEEVRYASFWHLYL